MTPHQLKEKIDRVYLIDVREEDELEDILPQAKSIPLSKFKLALHLSEHDFKKTFGFDKYTKDDEIVAICLSGARSGHVAMILRQMGFNAHNLDGGMLAWKR